MGNAMDDPVVEARKTLALLLGVGGGEGLLSRLEKEVEGVFGGVEGAFVEEGGGEGVGTCFASSSAMMQDGNRRADAVTLLQS